MNTNSFQRRHIGPNIKEQDEMLATIKAANLEQLITETVPDNIRLKNELDLAPALSEYEYLAHIKKLSEKNKVFKSYIGLGYHEAIVPSVIQRNILENPGWYTAYTPYQAEIAQGRLEALLNYQTMICDLTGMELANASLLDESTAAAEAMALLYDVRERSKKKAGANKFFVSDEILPQTLSLLQTRSTPIGIELVIGNHEDFDFSDAFFGAILQYPGKYGQIFDYENFVSKANENNIKVAVAADILSLVKLKAPGEFGASVVVGTTQRFGIPLGYGGPHAAYFATKESYKRSIPGRIIGVTKDKNGKRALRMALQTREQHIKREKATSNICTAQVLLAVMAGMYAVYHGKDGLQYIADSIHQKTTVVAGALESLGFKQINTAYFDTLLVEVDTEKLKVVAEANEINFNYIDQNHISISINETVGDSELKAIIQCFEKAFNITAKEFPKQASVIAENTKRNTPFLENKIFNKPLKFTFIKDIQDPYYSQLFYQPEISYNFYNGLILGTKLHNKPLIKRNLEFKFAPSYATKSNSVIGEFSVLFNQYIEETKIYKIMYGVFGQTLDYAPNLSYSSLVPFANIIFKRKSLRDATTQSISAKLVHINKEIAATDVRTDQDNYGVFSLSYNYINPDIIKEFRYNFSVEVAEKFSKAAVDLRFRSLSTSDTQLDFRFFAGAFLSNKTAGNYFSFGLDRANDYLFQLNYFGRSEDSGFFSQQYIIAEGGFKSVLPTRFANQYMFAFNSSFGLWRWIELYNDVAFLKNKNNPLYFGYNNGIRFNFVHNILEVYFPLYSNNGWEISQKRYPQKIRFTLTADINSIYNFFRRGLL